MANDDGSGVFMKVPGSKGSGGFFISLPVAVIIAACVFIIQATWFASSYNNRIATLEKDLQVAIAETHSNKATHENALKAIEARLETQNLALISRIESAAQQRLERDAKINENQQATAIQLGSLDAKLNYIVKQIDNLDIPAKARAR